MFDQETSQGFVVAFQIEAGVFVASCDTADRKLAVLVVIVRDVGFQILDLAGCRHAL